SVQQTRRFSPRASRAGVVPDGRALNILRIIVTGYRIATGDLRMCDGHRCRGGPGGAPAANASWVVRAWASGPARVPPAAVARRRAAVGVAVAAGLATSVPARTSRVPDGGPAGAWP